MGMAKRMEESPRGSTTEECPSSDSTGDCENEEDDEGAKTPSCPFELDVAHGGDDLLALFFCLFWHPCGCGFGGCRWLAEWREKDKGAKEPKWWEH